MFEEIKIVCLDVDGTLTDGVYQISDKGEITKSFFTRDFYGIQKLLENDIIVAIISQSHDKVIHEQIARIRSHSDLWSNSYEKKLFVYNCIEDKQLCVEEVMMKYNRKNNTKIWWENVAYMGDAENDIGCMELAKLTGCPADAIDEMEHFSNFPSDFPGGKGAVYDFCKYILED
jgi:3-deoxy-D-manno-octulosonate 8-phosphate phosphatase (KDO 8-P phosphatase)